jgi:ribosomal protein L12E/L44/L45/RPP1/RPP2
MDESALPLKVQVDIWRQKAMAGTMTDEEMKQAIHALRAGRTAAVANSPKAKTATEKAKAAQVADDILGELGL